MILKWLLPCIITSFACSSASDTHYKVGVGRADCTGPAAEITFMGYAKMGQRGCGIHLRQFSRAFLFQSEDKWAAFVSIDGCMVNTGLKTAVLKKLNESYPGKFTDQNLVLSGTHTHSGPGGFLMDVMLDIPNLGFVKETFDSLVTGISKSVDRAMNNMRDADIYVNSGIANVQSNINRSPAAYLYNPQEERDKYKDIGDTDKEMYQLKFVDPPTGEVFGAINWFPVHPTSMNNTNCLISSDNVGYASILLETLHDKSANKLSGKSTFVGAFASANLGDVSPNIKGPKCINTGEPCDKDHSSCNGQNKYCIASGPGINIFDSTQIIANRLFDKAVEILKDANSTAEKLTGPLGYIHQFVSMPNKTITLPGSNKKVSGCKPAMGYGFAAGTIDGPGEFDFQQATNTTNPFWNFVRDFIFPPSPADVECHAPKPILIMSGNIKLPYEWQPEVVATQILRIGKVFIPAVPGEFTTMSGRRLRTKLKDTLKKNGVVNATVILAGLSNTYTNYIATPEEYQMQRYEGASTIYGPHTLDIYLQQYSDLAEALAKNKTVPEDLAPYEFPDKLMSLVTPVLFDTAGWDNNFGDCIQQPYNSKTGDIVSAKFISGHPRNNQLLEESFLTVEKLDSKNKNWTVIANDASWETKFIWGRVNGILGSSQAEIRWDTTGAKKGTYRISHTGYYKYILGGINRYSGYSNSFELK